MTSRSERDKEPVVYEMTVDDVAVAVIETTVSGAEHEANINKDQLQLDERVAIKSNTAVKLAKANVGDRCDDVDESMTQHSSSGLDCKQFDRTQDATTDNRSYRVQASANAAAANRGNVSDRPVVPVKKIQLTLSLSTQNERKTETKAGNRANQPKTVKDVSVNGRAPASGWDAAEVKKASATAAARASGCRGGTDAGRQSTTTSLAPRKPAASQSTRCLSGQHQQRTGKSSNAVAAAAKVTTCAGGMTLASTEVRKVDGNASAKAEERQQPQLASSTVSRNTEASVTSDSSATSAEGSRQTAAAGNSRTSRSSAYDQHVNEWTKGLVHQRKKVVMTISFLLL